LIFPGGLRLGINELLFVFGHDDHGIIVASRRKTWEEKLADKNGYPKVLVLEEGFPCYRALNKMGAEAGDSVVLVNPSEIVPLMAQVP
jgi:hypothetical protein